MTTVQRVRFEICRAAVSRGGFARYTAEQAVRRVMPGLAGIRVTTVAIGELKWLVAHGYLLQVTKDRWLQTTATWDALKQRARLLGC